MKGTRACVEDTVKILIYSHYFLPSVGGVERLVASMARGFSEKGHRVCVATATGAGTFDESTLPYRVVRLPSMAALVRLIREHDVFHLAGPALAPMLLGYLLRKPVVIEHHMYQAICPNGLLVYQPNHTVCPGHFIAGRHRECLRCNAALGKGTSFRMWLLGFPRLWLSRRAATNVAITEHVSRRLDLPRSRLIYHGVQTATPAAASPGIAADQCSTVCFAYAGRFVKEKGLALLIQAAGRLAREGLSFRLKFIGDGPERANLEAEVRDRQLQDRTTFTGMLGPEELQQEMAGVTALVMPSIWEETAGLAAMEQMMRGRALIVSEIGGLSEVVGDAGLRFPAGDAVALSACMRKVIEEPEVTRQLGAAARRRSLALFSEDAMIDKHIQLYRDVSSRPEPPATRQPLG
jgi:glycosyltransferase involved in cell wall biosynthesis